MKTVEVLSEVLTGKRMSESSRENYKAVFRSLGRMYEEFPVKSFEVNRWLVSLDGYADQTVRLWFTVLRGACRYMEDNYGLVNPCKGLEAPKVQKKRRRYFKAEEIVKMLRACKDEFELALITTLVDSACRVGGLAKLKGSDVGEGYINVTEKTGERRYRLDVRICGILKRLAGSDDGLVFGLSSNGLSMRVIRIARRAGLKGEKLGAHTLRHSSASLVASETHNVMAVKALLQHDNIQTSMIYIHDVEEELLKGISPLQLVADRVKDGGVYSQKQLPMVGTPDNGVVEVEEVLAGIDDLVGEMYPEIKDGITVHSRLRSEDLRLIRKFMIEYARSNDGDALNQRGRALLKRMLRRVK